MLTRRQTQTPLKMGPGPWMATPVFCADIGWVEKGASPGPTLVLPPHTPSGHRPRREKRPLAALARAQPA
jgi:hypothetical protein